MNNGLPKVIASQIARRIDAVSSAARYGSSGSTAEKESGAPGYQHSAELDWNRGGANRMLCDWGQDVDKSGPLRNQREAVPGVLLGIVAGGYQGMVARNVGTSRQIPGFRGDQTALR